MERSEPALVPEWLRSAGNVAGGVSSVHHQASSSHTDAASLANHTRNRISKSSSDFDNPRSAYLERSSSSNSRSSSNGSAKHLYSSFNRNHRDRDNARSSFRDHWDHDSSDPLATIFPGKMEKDTLRRSHSMISRKQSEFLPRRVVVDAKIGTNNNQINGNDILSGSIIGSSIQKAVFDKDFPSLGTEERPPAVSDIIRVPSPVLFTAGQSLPVGSSALIGGEGWISALAKVPDLIGSSSGSLSVHHTVPVISTPASPRSTAALNMAEALTQAPSRAHTAPLVSVKTQRLEELAMKQSRQLIPVTPTMPKASVFSSSEKSKPKAAAKNADVNVASMNGLQPLTPSHLGIQSVRSGNVKSDVSVANGKLVVLKPRENGVSMASKDALSPINNTIGKGGSQNTLAPSVFPAHSKSPNNGKLSTERKAALDSKSGPTFEKRASLSQVQSRNDFFNLIKKKTSKNNLTSESGPVMSAITTHNSNEPSRVVAIAPVSPHALENGNKVASNGDTHGQVHTLPDYKQNDMTAYAAIFPDEEEAAFLRSLGWEENSGEDEGLTEEEINTFVHQYTKLIPSLKLCQGMQPKLSNLSESWTTNSGRASTELSSSDAESGV